MTVETLHAAQSKSGAAHVNQEPPVMESNVHLAIAPPTFIFKDHTFFQEPGGWVDAQIPQARPLERVRVKFDSPEFFDLMHRCPYALPWALAARNVQFLCDATVYEIYS